MAPEKPRGDKPRSEKTHSEKTPPEKPHQEKLTLEKTSHEILLVEDQTLVRKSLTALINATAGFAVTTSVETVAEALAQLQQPHRFSLLLCDFNLRGETALDLLQRLPPKTAPPVILLTSFFNAVEIQHCLSLGARGFLFKECDLDELLLAFRQVLAGNVYFTLAQIQSQGETPQALTLTLTPSEREILRWLGTGMSNKQIALTLGKSSETVKVQVAQLLRKLDCRSRTQAVVKAAQLNLL